jgi:hypothetical protein
MNTDFDPRCHIGESYGVYTIVDVLNEKDKYGHYVYKCVCNECGYIKYAHYGKISGEKSRTTKCSHLRANGEYIPYGHSWSNQRIGNIFQKMIRRCYNVSDKDYRWYGEKGIKICNDWLYNPKLFEKWALNNGYADNLTIDRINSDQDYCPENCQWIPSVENSRKAGKVTWITINNETLTGRQWSEKFHLGVNTINTAIRNYGLDKTKELIIAMIKDNPSTKHRKSHQTWFDVYGIQV